MRHERTDERPAHWTRGYCGTDRYPATVPAAYNVPPPPADRRPALNRAEGRTRPIAA
jgi:hypothetical protein